MIDEKKFIELISDITPMLMDLTEALMRFSMAVDVITAKLLELKNQALEAKDDA